MLDLQDYGFSSHAFKYSDEVIPARITEIRRELYKAVCMYGEVSANIKGTFYHGAQERGDFPAVGDFVLLKYNDNGNSGIVEILPRKSKFSRVDLSGHAAKYAKTVLEQVVAANFDYVFIMSSLNQDFSTGRIARYLTAAYQSGGMPVIILTKADLCANAEEHVAAIERIAVGVPVIAVSSVTGQGLEQLGEYLKPKKTVVFLGMSGIGKSSLLNALAGQELMSVKAIREDDARGRHTTTHRQLVMLQSGAMVIDTPGMRELGLWNAEEGISVAFSDVEDLFLRCRFSDCSHQNEPGCAVLAALETKSLTHEQWEQYQAQKREAAFVEDKTGYLRERNEKHKSISKLIRKHYKDKGKY